MNAHSANRFRRPPAQRGAALLVLLMLILTGLAVALVSRGAPGAARNTLDQEQALLAAVAQAKQALIGRAARNPGQPGALPCPDTDNNGAAQAFAGANCPANTGRLPWLSLGLPPLFDSSGEILWYALSPSHREHNSAQPLNSETAGQISVDATSDVAAVIIAPGAALTGQNRSSNNAADYLEGANADGNDTFTAITGAAANDRVFILTRAELMAAVEARVSTEALSLLLRYQTACGQYPDAAAFDPTAAAHDSVAAQREGLLPSGTALPTSWGAGCAAGIAATELDALRNNNWDDLLYYAKSASAPPCIGVNCLQINGTVIADVVVSAAGRALAAQAGRPSASLAEYFESGNVSTGDDAFSRGPRSSTFNDNTWSHKN
jgi:type II secretory pathway pseudopilin PulG